MNPQVTKVLSPDLHNRLAWKCLYFAAMFVLLFDPPGRNSLLPLSATRAIADLRMGMLTIRERWQYWTGHEVLVQTAPYLQSLYPFTFPNEATDCIWVDASIIPDELLLTAIQQLGRGESLRDKDGWIAARTPMISADAGYLDAMQSCSKVTELEAVTRLRYPWELVQWNDNFARGDFRLLARGNKNMRLPDSVNVTAPDQVFIEPGAKLAYCTLNASTGPIYSA